jgi:putative peptidoglycan lipid II flippase
VVLAALAEPLVVAVFQHGEFDAHSAEQTARALVWQGSAVWAIVTTRQLVRAFYVLRDTRTPLVVSAVGVATFFGLAMALRGEMGHPAISAAGAASSILQMLILCALLRRRLPALRLGAIAMAALRALVPALLAGAGAASGALLLAPSEGSDALGRAIPALAGAGIFVGAFLGLARALHIPELKALIETRRPPASSMSDDMS